MRHAWGHKLQRFDSSDPYFLFCGCGDEHGDDDDCSGDGDDGDKMVKLLAMIVIAMLVV